MKITLYTITDCPFSKQEKEYLKSHSLTFEEKNLESNKEFLTEMLAISNNFAGTPVTKVEKDDGQISILKGFTKDEFDKTLEFTTQPANPSTSSGQASQLDNQSVPTPPPGPEPPKPVSPVPPPPQPVVPPVVEPPKPFQPVTPPVTPPSQPASPKNDQLEALLANLQSKAAAPPPVPNSAPSIPNFQ